MNKIRCCFFTILCIIFSSLAYSAQIDENEALQIAQQFYNQKKTSLLRSTPDFRLVYACKDSTSLLRSTNTQTYFYIFNVGKEQGFVIVSGNDLTKKILGYSDEGALPVENMPENLKTWLELYQSEIKYAIENVKNPMAFDSENMVNSSMTDYVSPLLGNIKWNQYGAYNILCPSNAEGVHAVAGCVAIAMAQIMKYHEWPVSGTGSHSYDYNPFINISADFGHTYYDWDNMQDRYSTSSTPRQDTAVATLIYHCGVSVNMKYGINSSAAQSKDATNAFTNYFGYDSDLQIHYKENYNEAQWKTMIKNELINKRPILYSAGTLSLSGHAFVCDGYDSSDMFHINWGWGGYGNGYFELSSLYSGAAGSINVIADGYSVRQAFIGGIMKPDGIDNVTYKISMYKSGLFSSEDTLENINSSTTNLVFGCKNISFDAFKGKIGIGLYQNGIMKAVLIYSNISELLYNWGWSKYESFKGVSLSNLNLVPGNYRIYCIYKPTDSTSWSFMNATNNWNNYLDVIISGSTSLSAVIQRPVSSPILTLTQAIQHQNLYQNRKASFSVTIQNTGTEYNSAIALYLRSTTDASAYQLLDYGNVCISSGQTKTFELTGTITSTPGNYYAIAAYDSTNTISLENFKPIGPDNYGKLPVSIESGQLSLTQKLRLSKDTLHRNEPFTVYTSISNTDSNFYGSIYAYIYPENEGQYLAIIGPKNITINTNDTVSTTLSGSISLNPGRYRLCLFYKLEEDLFKISTKDAAIDTLFFTLEEAATALDYKQTRTFSIYPNPVKGQLNIQTEESVLQAHVSDLSGRIILQVSNSKILSVHNLKSGLYLLQIRTENGTKTVKFMKE